MLQSFDAYGPGELFCRDALQECHRQRLLSSLTAGAQCVATPDLSSGGFSGGGAPPVRPFPIPGPGSSFPDSRYPDPRFPDPHYPGPSYPGPNYPGPSYPGPTYPAQRQLLVKSGRSGDVYKFSPDTLAVASGCLEYYCVGQTVYPRSWNHSRGGRVIAINLARGKYTVVSNQSGDVYKFSAYEL